MRFLQVISIMVILSAQQALTDEFEVNSLVESCDTQRFSELEENYPPFVSYSTDQDVEFIIENTFGCRYSQDFWYDIPSLEAWASNYEVTSPDGEAIGTIEWFAAPHSEPLKGYAILDTNEYAAVRGNRYAIPIELLDASPTGDFVAAFSGQELDLSNFGNDKSFSSIQALKADEVYPGKLIDGFDFSGPDSLVPGRDFFAPGIITEDAIRAGIIRTANQFGQSPFTPAFLINIQVSSEPTNASIFIEGNLAGFTQQNYVIQRQVLDTMIISTDGYRDCEFSEAVTAQNHNDDILEIRCSLIPE